MQFTKLSLLNFKYILVYYVMTMIISKNSTNGQVKKDDRMRVTHSCYGE